VVVGEVKVLGIHGSPHRYGESFKLLEIALETAKREGANIELINLYDYRISPCIGCVSDNVKYCKYPCDVVNDDFPKLARKVLEADAIIFASPIYWYMVSGVMKNFIDRLTCFENMIHHTGRSLLEGKVVAFIVTGNDTGAIMAIAWLMITLNSMGAVIPPWALAYYHQKASNVLEDEQVVLDAANIGKIVVQAARAVKNTGVWYDASLKEFAKKIISSKIEEWQKKQKEELETRKRLFGEKA